ncbi:MAG: MBL fold metallo-hydrolase [Methanobrevibacter wolinii]|uniref:MBL fold metallo-hydrolase n=1 Tax=Methanobrevibacter wolinii TaxID=190977 RepID=UPI0005B2E09E|nr:MBL fold metallo-hydrolase [Methanobrevibacter wolinii]MDD5960639.1 MBL fold metallo-hydrolase [Methanobrevibacter wolinii]
MRIIFLGTGGGRFATISQKRMTGGFRIDNINGFNLHVDPGPGGLIRTLQYGLNPTKLNGIFVSHCHTDHYNDAEILIEAMTKGMTKNKGCIIGSKSVMEGHEKWGPCISNYHKSHSKNYTIEPGKEIDFGKFKMKGTKTIHGDPYGTGFQLKTKNICISYTSDTRYYDELADYHKGADILIGSILRPGDNGLKGHMCSDDFINLINEVKPKLAIMTHFGFKMLKHNPKDEAKRIKHKTGVKTIAASDGLSIDIDFKNVNKSYLSKSKIRAVPGKHYKNIFNY